MVVFVRWWCLVLVGSCLLVVGCTNDRTLESIGDPTSPGVDSPTSTSTVSTIELAPSQITASTVEAPESPPPCVPGKLATWTAQVIVAEASADAVLRIRNDGDVWCEVSVRESPLIDPMMESDVWLNPGEWADLVVGQSGDGCLAPEAITVAAIDVNGRPVTVPTAMVSACGWWLTALYPNEAATGPCDPADLGVTTTGALLVVRNDSFEACSVGQLVSILDGTADGNTEGDAETDTETDTEGDAETDTVRIGAPSRSADAAVTRLAITDLAPGDVIGFALVDDPFDGCSGSFTSHSVTFSIAGTLKARLPSCQLVRIGPGRPFYGDPSGPLSGVDPGSFDLGTALAELDPFTSSGDDGA